jgi:hypothetical protein
MLSGSNSHRINQSGVVQRRKRSGIWLTLSQTLTGKGYPAVKIAGRQYTVHRLVASMFVANPFPMDNREVHHIDEDILNYNPSNLEWTNSTDHKGLHMLKAQAELNKPIKGDGHTMIGVRKSTRTRINKMRGATPMNDYINYLLDGEE